MDWIRYPYRAKCRFTQDPSVLRTIVWRAAAPDAPTLPFGSAICNVALENDPLAFQPTPGEIWTGPRRGDWRHLPLQLPGNHYCGTEEDFASGCAYPPAAPVKYGAWGWPICCGAPVKVYGAAGGGGSSPVSVVPAISLYGFAGAAGDSPVSIWLPPAVPTGGMALGGRVPTTLPTRPPTGGMALGGCNGPPITLTMIFWLWLQGRDVPSFLTWSVCPFADGIPGTALYAGSTEEFVDTGNQDRQGLGYEIWQGTAVITTPPCGTWWVCLQGGSASGGDQFYWDISDGPSIGYASGEGGLVAGVCCGGCSGSCTFQLLSGDTVVYDNTNPAYPGTYYTLDPGCGAFDVSTVTDEIVASTFTLTE